MAGRKAKSVAQRAKDEGVSPSTIKRRLTGAAQPTREEKLKQESLVDLRAAGDDKQRPPPVEAAAVLHHRGFATLHNALAESQLGHDAQQGLVQAARSVDAGAAAALAGTLAASLLPTVHNNYAYFRQAMGAQLGERAAALAFAALPEPSLLGCTQAVVGTYELFDLSLNGFGQQFACTTAQHLR